MLEALASLLTPRRQLRHGNGAKTSRQCTPVHRALRDLPGQRRLAERSRSHDLLWQKFCDAAGRPDWKDHPKYAAAPDRVRNRDEIMPLITEVLRTKTRAEWISSGCGGRAVALPQQSMKSATLKTRGMIWEMEHNGGVVRTIANPIEFSGTKLATPAPPPRSVNTLTRFQRRQVMMQRPSPS